MWFGELDDNLESGEDVEEDSEEGLIQYSFYQWCLFVLLWKRIGN